MRKSMRKSMQIVAKIDVHHALGHLHRQVRLLAPGVEAPLAVVKLHRGQLFLLGAVRHTHRQPRILNTRGVLVF